MIYKDPLRALSLNCYFHEKSAVQSCRGGKIEIRIETGWSDLMPTDWLTRLVINYSRGADFRQPYESTRTTKAERGDTTDYATIPLSNSSVVLIFVKKSIRSSVYSYRPDPFVATLTGNCVKVLLDLSKVLYLPRTPTSRPVAHFPTFPTSPTSLHAYHCASKEISILIL